MDKKQSISLNQFLKEWNNDSDKLLVHTSGSTGQPKPLWVEKGKMLNSARITCDFLELKSNDTALLCMPLDYIAGKMMVVRTIERNMKLLTVPPSGHPLSSSSLAHLDDDKQEITFAAMVPLQVYNTLQVPEERQRLKQIKHLIIGGGAIESQLEAEIATLPHSVWSTYGMTETLSHIALRRLNGPFASKWYHPLPGVEVALNGDNCLVIKAPAVCDSILVTNDIAELSSSVSSNASSISFRIKGRKDNVIDSGGIKIQIEEVEQQLRPYIKGDYAITSCPNQKFGEQVILLTTCKDTKTIANICLKHLPKYWQPKQIIGIEHLPVTETGKPARAKIKELAISLQSS